MIELVSVCDGTGFDQLLRVSQEGHTDETAGWPVFSHVFLEQSAACLKVLLRVCQIDLHISEVRPRDTKSRQHAIEILQRLPGLCLDIVLANERV